MSDTEKDQEFDDYMLKLMRLQFIIYMYSYFVKTGNTDFTEKDWCCAPDNFLIEYIQNGIIAKTTNDSGSYYTITQEGIEAAKRIIKNRKAQGLEKLLKCDVEVD